MNPRYEQFLNELREENLLEEGIPQAEPAADSSEAVKIFGDEFLLVVNSDDDVVLPAVEAGSEGQSSDGSAAAIHESKPPDVKALYQFLDFHDSIRERVSARPDSLTPEPPSESGTDKELALPGLSRENAIVRNQLKKRAIDEVNGLHMVDHVLCAAEREQRKTVSHPHDGLHLKQALHDFIQALDSEDVTSIQVSERHFMQETEKWLWELFDKDGRLTVADLRRYCETAKPALSPKALSTLAKFYRNAPFSYAVRDKFELVMTRLFSRETVDDKRKALYSADVMAKQIGGMYAEWASLQTYSEDDSFTVVDAAKRLELMMKEAEFADTFENLIGDDFFTRLRAFKEGLHEEFFSPIVTAAAVECNIVVGNRFIELLEKERVRDSVESLGEKFADACVEDVSHMTGKTIEVAEKMCGERRKAARAAKVRVVAVPAQKKSFKKRLASMLSIGPWLFVVLAVVGISSVAIYFGAKRMIFESEGPAQIKRVNLENSSLGMYVQGATLSGETVVGMITPAWDTLDENEKSDVLRRLLSVGATNGFKYVRLTDFAGRTVAAGTPDRIDIR